MRTVLAALVIAAGAGFVCCQNAGASPFAATAKKHLPPPHGEMSHMRRLALGAIMPKRILAKFATINFLPVF